MQLSVRQPVARDLYNYYLWQRGLLAWPPERLPQLYSFWYHTSPYRSIYEHVAHLPDSRMSPQTIVSITFSWQHLWVLTAIPLRCLASAQRCVRTFDKGLFGFIAGLFHVRLTETMALGLKSAETAFFEYSHPVWVHKSFELHHSSCLYRKKQLRPIFNIFIGQGWYGWLIVNS